MHPSKFALFAKVHVCLKGSWFVGAPREVVYVVMSDFEKMGWRVSGVWQ